MQKNVSVLGRMVHNAIRRRTHRQDYLLQDRSPRTELLREGLFSVKVFHPLSSSREQIEGETVPVEQQHRLPLLLVPPLGVFAWIFDLMAERSLVRYFLARGFTVYLVDWGQPGREESNLDLQTYALNWMPKAVNVVQQHSGQQQISLLGYCMGGLLSLVYTAASAARGQDYIANIITIASPINLHQMSGMIGRAARIASMPSGWIKRLTGQELSLFSPKLFHVDGRVLSILFRLSQPKATLSSYLDLVKNLADDDYVSRYMTMNEWFSHMPDYPGATIQEMIQRWGLANGMAEGQFKLGGEVVDFKNITCPILAFAGTNDAITSIESACALMTVVSSTDLSFEVVPGGHAGVFTGSKAVNTTWAIAADWLAMRSDPPLRDADAHHLIGQTAHV